MASRRLYPTGNSSRPIGACGTILAEDEHPWIEAHPRATLVVAILRCIAYTLLLLFRSVTQRSDERRTLAWKTLMNEVSFALATTCLSNLKGLHAALLKEADRTAGPTSLLNSIERACRGPESLLRASAAALPIHRKPLPNPRIAPEAETFFGAAPARSGEHASTVDKARYMVASPDP